MAALVQVYGYLPIRSIIAPLDFMDMCLCVYSRLTLAISLESVFRRCTVGTMPGEWIGNVAGLGPELRRPAGKDFRSKQFYYIYHPFPETPILILEQLHLSHPQVSSPNSPWTS